MAETDERYQQKQKKNINQKGISSAIMMFFYCLWYSIIWIINLQGKRC